MSRHVYASPIKMRYTEADFNSGNLRELILKVDENIRPHRVQRVDQTEAGEQWAGYRRQVRDAGKGRQGYPTLPAAHRRQLDEIASYERSDRTYQDNKAGRKTGYN